MSCAEQLRTATRVSGEGGTERRRRGVVDPAGAGFEGDGDASRVTGFNGRGGVSGRGGAAARGGGAAARAQWATARPGARGGRRYSPRVRLAKSSARGRQ